MARALAGEVLPRPAAESTQWVQAGELGHQVELRRCGEPLRDRSEPDAVGADPDVVLGRAAENLDRLLAQHQGTMTEVWLTRWREKLRQGPGAVLKVLTSEDPEAVELRQNSPFAGVLSEPQRQQVLKSFTHSGWEHAA